MPSCSIVLAKELRPLARSAGAPVFAASRSFRYAPPPTRANRALVATESSATALFGSRLCMWVLTTTDLWVPLYAEQRFALASPSCWGTEAWWCAGWKYASAARTVATVASARAAYAGHRDASDPCGKGTGFLEEDSSLAEDCFGLSGLADLLKGLAAIGRAN